MVRDLMMYELPFLLIASDTGRHAEKDADNGIAGFISKTIHKDEIIARLHAALAPRSGQTL